MQGSRDTFLLQENRIGFSNAILFRKDASEVARIPGGEAVKTCGDCPCSQGKEGDIICSGYGITTPADWEECPLRKAFRVVRDAFKRFREGTSIDALVATHELQRGLMVAYWKAQTIDLRQKLTDARYELIRIREQFPEVRL